MLVLSRKVGEQVMIGDGVVVKLLAIRGRQVRLGVQAPDSVAIWRGEMLWTETDQENDDADAGMDTDAGMLVGAESHG